MQKRIVITGMGIITPIGIGIDEFWQAVVEGQSGIGPITAFDTSDYRVHIGAEVKTFDPGRYFGEARVPSFARQAQFALASTKMAFDDSGVSPEDFDPMRTGVVIGTLSGEADLLENSVATLVKSGLKAVDAEPFFSYPIFNTSRVISSRFGFYGPSETIYCACSSGNMAIARACDLIEMGRVDAVAAGGIDIFTMSVFVDFEGLRLLAPTCCQPFDKNRQGLVVAEGAGILLIQSLESAQKRGQHIYAEIKGYGLSCDAYHTSSSDPEARGISASMKMALADAKLDPDRIEYVSAHGTGTKMNDRVETLALKKIFGPHSKNLLISSVKSMIGHSMGAASAIEAIVCCLVLNRHIIPPTINYQEPDPECDLNYVPNRAVEYPARISMNNSMAFGGINASLILETFKGM